MSNVLVYSCVTGGYDKIAKTLLLSKAIPEDNVTYALFTDQPGDVNIPQDSTIDWQIRPLKWQHPLCNRRTARWHKMHSHILARKFDYSVWIDGSQIIKPIKLWKELEPVIQKHDLASFKHPDRTCVYQEITACRRLKKENLRVMQQQIDKYRIAGYPPYAGLVETACVVRKNVPEITEFNKLWWEQIQLHSFRDQLSFNYTAWKLKLPYGRIPGHRARSPFFDFVSHKR